MSFPVSLEVCYRKNKSTQNCVIPTELLKNSNLKIDDYVTVKSLNEIYICKITTPFLSSMCLSIFVDDSVTSSKSSCKSISSQQRHSKYITFPDDVCVVNISKFAHVLIKIIYRENCNILNCAKTIYENVAHEILSKYVLKRNCIVNCNGSERADFFQIQSILIVDAYPEEHEYGKLTRSSLVEITDIMSCKQMDQMQEVIHFHLGGMERYLRLLKMNLVEMNYFQTPKSFSVLVTGPSGCGKSSLVKKFCSDTEYFLVFIDGSGKEQFTKEKCDMYTSQILNYLNMFPLRPCILFIDDIDALIPCDKKKSLIVTLIENLKNVRVFIIATAVYKMNIHHLASSLFESEISIGIPSQQERKEMIEASTKSLHCTVDYDKISLITPGFIGHDISRLIKEALGMKQAENSEEAPLTTKDLEKALSKISPSVLKSSVWNFKVQPVYWKDIGGMFNVKKKLQMCIEWPLKNPKVFKKVDLPCPRGILLFGPPGCCKTTLARGLATECNANFFAANPAQIYSAYVGESEKNISQLFYHARLAAPSIIFLDELDTLVTRRKLDSKSQGVAERVLSTLLNEMDGFGSTAQFQNNMNMQKLLLESVTNEVSSECISNNVIVVGATNRPDLIDSAMLRPGRFDVILYVPPPNTEERESILKTLTNCMRKRDIDFKSIAERTNLFSGADLKNLCHEAAMISLRHDISSDEYVTTDCFNEALKIIQPSITKQQIEMYENLSRKYGHH